MSEPEQKIKKARGIFVGTTYLAGNGLESGTYDVFIDKGNFCLSLSGKFVKHIKASALRIAGIFNNSGKKTKKVFGRFGYIGCPKR